MVEKFEYHIERYALSIANRPKDQKEMFDELGKDGWELISVVPLAEVVPFTKVPVTKAVIAYFKRNYKGNKKGKQTLKDMEIPGEQSAWACEYCNEEFDTEKKASKHEKTCKEK